MRIIVQRRVSRLLVVRNLVGIVAALVTGVVHAGPCDPPVNVIACENSNPGTPKSVWDINYGNYLGDDSIHGFATEISVNHGNLLQFKVNVQQPAAAFHVDIYRLGWYQGTGARLIQANIPQLPGVTQPQPSCYYEAAIGFKDCGNWAVSAEWGVPTDAVSGVYIARIVRNDDGGANHIPFIVRADESHSDIVVQTSDTTWQAYNGAFGYSLYRDIRQETPAKKVSYNRPFTTRDTSASNPYGFNRSYFFSGEYPAVRWLERNGYDVTYVTGVDVDRSGGLLLNHKVFMSVGHDEYWSRAQRDYVEAARDAGVNLAFLSGNTMFWKIRWEDSQFGSGDRRTLVCYKESAVDEKIDPSPVWTGLWRDPRFVDPQGPVDPLDAGRPENSLLGVMSRVGGTCPWDGINWLQNDRIEVPYEYSRFRLWRNSLVAFFPPGFVYYMAVGTLGYEWDADVLNAARPSHLLHMSAKTVSQTCVIHDFANSPDRADSSTHHVTLYRHGSGALVFSAASVQWSWGLDSVHDYLVSPPPQEDGAIQQATVNLLADMGAQPSTLSAELVPATQSTDMVAPAAEITGPPAILTAGTVRIGNAVSITGTATDTDGAVALVEVSVDGGLTYRPATGTTNWSFTWVPKSFGTATLSVRATDDSGNSLEPAQAYSVTCAKSGFDEWDPVATSSPLSSEVELGVKFRSDRPGWITGLRFHKAPGNVGTHLGRLWSSSGEELAQAQFSNETASGWQEVSFTSAYEIQANTTYVASYHASSGHWSYNWGYFGSEVVRWPLRFLGSSDPSGPNGVYKLGAGFPTESSGDQNYWVDIVFVPSVVPSTASLWDDQATPVVVDKPIGASEELGVKFSADTEGVVSGIRFYKGLRNIGSHNGSVWRAADGTFLGQTDFGAEERVGWQTSLFRRPIRVVPNTTYVASYWAPVGHWAVDRPYFTDALVSPPLRSPAEAGLTLNGVNCTGGCFPSHSAPYPYNAANYWVDLVFQPDTPPPAGQFWSDTVVPGTTAFPDGQGVELGLKFRSDVDASVRGVRFYKGPGNVGTHVAHLWAADGTPMGAVAFSGESEVGWQQVDFGEPVTIYANTTYVVSYYAPNGNYAVDRQYFANDILRPPLHALANTPSSPNGVYRYGAGFPSSAPAPPYHSSNYWVDVVLDVPDCPATFGCTADACAGSTTCRRVAGTSSDTGLTSCRQPDESWFGCTGSQTIRVVSGNCVKCACCNQVPGCFCPPSCGTYQWLDCQ